MSKPPLTTHVMKTLALTSGKGGVGKSNIAVNLAITLALRGNKVCILDADTGLANINILLGVTPQYTLEHLLNGQKALSEILITGPAGIHVIPGASGIADCVDLAPEQQASLMRGLDDLESHYDYLLIDTGAGISATVMHFVAAAQTPVVVITPEPTSLTDAFSLLRVLHRSHFRRPVQVLVNMAPNAGKALQIFNRFEAAVEKYIGMQIYSLGAICLDRAVVNAVARQYPVALGAPNTCASRDFNQLADKIDTNYKTDTIKSLNFSHYWRQCMTRATRVERAESSVSPARRSQTSPTRMLPFQERTPQYAENCALTPQTFADNVWLSASTQLKQLIELGNIGEHQISKLIDELRVLASNDGEKTKPEGKGTRPSLIYKSNITTSLPKKNSPTNQDSLVSKDMNFDPSVTIPKHQYDESTFGSQELLLKQLKRATTDDKLPLLALLERVIDKKAHE